MERAELEKKMIEFVAVSYNKTAEEISMETNFETDLTGASIQMVGLVSLIENELDVLIPLPTASACVTVKELTDKVEAML